MDFFLGSGTTVAVAHKLNRKWLGVEMGGCFKNFYYACKDIKKTDIDKYEIAGIVKENKNSIKAIVKCLGLLGRMKIVLKGDKNFMDIKRSRRSGLSRSINWNGGGFFKYYELEQYEDALKKAVYNPTNEELENIDFSLSEKQAKVALDIDFKKEKAKFVFEKLYPDVDIPETISNLFGKKIKKVTKDKVIFTDDSEVDLNNLDFDKYDPLKKLIYWK